MTFSRPRFLSSLSTMCHGAHSGLVASEHRVARPQVVVAVAVGLQIRRRELPDLARVVDPALEPPGLLLAADVEEVLDQDDPVVDDRLLDQRDHLEEPLGLRRGAVAHHELDTGAVVPAAVEDHDLARRRELRDVALDVHLRADPRVRGGQRDVLEDAGARPLRDPPDRAALAGGVHALEHDEDPGAGRLDPLLHRHELALEDPHLPLVLLPLHLPGRLRGGIGGLAALVFLLVRLAHLSSPSVCRRGRSYRSGGGSGPVYVRTRA